MINDVNYFFNVKKNHNNHLTTPHKGIDVKDSNTQWERTQKHKYQTLRNEHWVKDSATILNSQGTHWNKMSS